MEFVPRNASPKQSQSPYTHTFPFAVLASPERLINAKLWHDVSQLSAVKISKCHGIPTIPNIIIQLYSTQLLVFILKIFDTMKMSENLIEIIDLAVKKLNIIRIYIIHVLWCGLRLNWIRKAIHRIFKFDINWDRACIVVFHLISV